MLTLSFHFLRAMLLQEKKIYCDNRAKKLPDFETNVS